MPATVTIDGIPATVEKLPSGCIRVSHRQAQINPMNGLDTGAAVVYEIHQCQRHQHQFFNALLPPAEQAMPLDPPRPWWSLGAGERATLKE